jgi:2-polyprenyl-3-methyl-5-hydroxy-6-metoxy-1,4-benzoquinol methylase
MRSTVVAGVIAAFNSPQKQIYKKVKRFHRHLGRNHLTRLVASLHPCCHQGPNKTALDRYPEIFSAAADALPNAKRILSFGCSTGEECVTLANYFPSAQIVGTDINPVNLLKAQKHRSKRVRFVYANDLTLSRYGGFDAVFCMAVLRTWKREQIAHYYPFDQFAERALFLESLVRPGGLLVLHGTTYRFGDTTRRYAYETIPTAATQETKIYLPDGVTEATSEGCIFRKLKSTGSLRRKVFLVAAKTVPLPLQEAA